MNDAATKLPDDRWRWSERLFWMSGLAVFFVLPGYLILGSQILIVGLAAASLDLLVGVTGILSLGHAAFFGLGAYAAGLLAVHGWGEPLSGLLVAAAVAAVVGWLVGMLVVRGPDLARLMTTLGIGLMLHEAANRASSITGGVDGLGGVTMWRLLGIAPFDLNGRTAYLYSLTVTLLLFVFLRRLASSPFGLSLRGLREGAARMPALGAPVRRRQVTIFAISAGVAGIAGALSAQTTQFVGLESLGFSRSADLLIMLVLGGTGRLYGGLVGAAAFMIMQDRLSGFDPATWQFWLGLLLILLVLVARGGILGGLGALARRLRK